MTAAGGVFDEVVARGMESSSLTFDTPVKDSTTGIHISFTGENYLQPNDRVNVYLPDFTIHASSSLQDGDAVPFTGDTSAVTMRWRDSLQALEMTLVESIKTVEVNIPKGTFMMGPFGANNYSTAVYSTDSKLPTISLRTENFRYFAPTPFQVFTPVGFFANSEITFTAPDSNTFDRRGDALAGQETAIFLSFDYSLGIYPGDAFFLSLPRFWTTKEANEISAMNLLGGNFSANWIACTETLEIIRHSTLDQDFLNTTAFTFTIRGLRLPYDGISPEMELHVNLSTNATQGVVEPVRIDSVQRVGKFLASSLTIASPTISDSSSNTLNVTFKSLNMLGIGDTVTLTLPGVTFSGNTITSTTQYEPLADTPTSMSASFSVSWDSSSYELTFTATAESDRNTSVVFDVVGAILPKEGFPVHRNYLQDGAFTNSSVTIRATSTNGNIAATELDEVTTVGFASDSTFVHYIIKDPRTSVGVRLQFKLSEPLAASDVITFYSPFLVAPSAWGNTETALAVLGDRGDKDLIENFDVTFNPASSEIKCTATAAEAAREINLYIEENNGLFIRFPEEEESSTALIGPLLLSRVPGPPRGARSITLQPMWQGFSFLMVELTCQILAIAHTMKPVVSDSC